MYTIYKINLYLDLDILLPVDRLIYKTYMFFYRIDEHFQRMVSVKGEEQKYFDNLLVIVNVVSS
jgi:hypothetical protein